MKRRIISAALSCATLLSLTAAALVSCGEQEQNDATTDAPEITSEPLPEEPRSGVPEDLDLGGIGINIWSPSNSAVVSETYVSFNAEETGEILDDTIFKVNRDVEEALNVDLNFYTDLYVSEAPNKIRSQILSGDCEYDAYHFIQYAGAPLSAEELYYNLKDAPYISFDAPWWDMKYMQEMTVGSDRLYCLVGDYAVDRTRTLNCVFYNKNLYGEYYGDPDALYDVVLEGGWTSELMRKICADVYTDLNNDGMVDRDDRLGMSLNTLSNVDGLFYGMGGRVTSRDKDDIPCLDMLGEHTADVCERLYQIAWETEGVYISGSSFDEEMLNRKKFSENSSMFLMGFFYTAESLRDMNADYGIIPVPKFDDSQSDYITGLHNIMRDIALPVNCQKVDEVCAVLEELAFRGYREVIPTYYEVVLKKKYARDDASAQMLDIIRNNCTTEIAYVYSDYFNRMGIIFRDMVGKRSSSIASYYAANEPAAREKMQTLIDQFLN